MPENVITALDQVTPAWLTTVLIRSGALEQGRVDSFAVDSNQRLLSTSVRLEICYSDDARGEMPRKLFLKMVDTDQDDEYFGPSEVTYYMRDYVNVPDVPLPRCYDAAFSDKIGRYGWYHILMEDVSATHIEGHRTPPKLEQNLVLAEGLAAMHAHWWGAARLKQSSEPLPDAAILNRFIDIARPGADYIIDACGDELGERWIKAIREVYAHHPQMLIDRAADTSTLTLIHGDVNLTNVLMPLEGDRPVYVIDRQPFNWSLTVMPGVYDLAYLMVLEWEPDVRRAFERPVLERYHEQLVQRGIQDYSWEQLWHDYRLMVAAGVYVATEWCRGAYNPDTKWRWMSMLSRALTAIDDLDCLSLWQSGRA